MESSRTHFKLKTELFSFSCFELLIASAWAYDGLLYYFETVIRLTLGNVIAKSCMAVYFIILIILTWNQINKRIRTSDIGFVIVILIILSGSFLLNPWNEDIIIQKLPETLFKVIPYYFVGLMIDNDDRTMRLLCFFSKWTIVVNWLYVFVILGTGREMQSDNLAIAYMVLPHALMLLWFAMRNRNKKHIILALISFVLLLFLGSRGPVLSFIVFFVIYNFIEVKSSVKKTLIRVIIPAAVVLIILFSGIYEHILLLLSNVALKMNLSTRIFDSILFDAGKGSNEERLAIYKTLFEYIKQRPFWGYGVFGEWQMIGYYAHNMLIELWVHYGLIFGSIISFFSLSKIIKTYLRTSNTNTKNFILLMCVFALLRGVYTGTYISFYVFMLMGFVIGQARNEKRFKMSEKGKAL